VKPALNPWAAPCAGKPISVHQDVINGLKAKHKHRDDCRDQDRSGKDHAGVYRHAFSVAYSSQV
jgi:hypothetical protein